MIMQTRACFKLINVEPHRDINSRQKWDAPVVTSPWVLLCGFGTSGLATPPYRLWVYDLHRGCALCLSSQNIRWLFPRATIPTRWAGSRGKTKYFAIGPAIVSLLLWWLRARTRYQAQCHYTTCRRYWQAYDRPMSANTLGDGLVSLARQYLTISFMILFSWLFFIC